MSSKKKRLLALRSKINKTLKSKKGSKNKRNEIAQLQKTLGKVNIELAKLSALHSSKSKHRKDVVRLDKLHGRKAKHRRGTEADSLAMKSKVNINTIGGLQFQATSPPGIGRLVSLPFYPTAVNADVTTAGGANVTSSNNPVCILDIGNTTNNTVTPFVMTTPQISWAMLRIVGFEVDIRTNCAQNTSRPTLLVSTLKVGGGTNLFTHEDYSDGMFYANDNDYYAGLRDYPLLVSPNTAQVLIGAISPTATNNTITFSAQLVCEVLSDQNYGAHIPGPYARGTSMVRSKGILK